jgi:hypothetical protein
VTAGVRHAVIQSTCTAHSQPPDAISAQLRPAQYSCKWVSAPHHLLTTSLLVISGQAQAQCLILWLRTFRSPSGTSTRLLKWKNTSVGRSTARSRPQLFFNIFTCGAGRRHTRPTRQGRWLCLHLDGTELPAEVAGRCNRCCDLAMLHANSVHRLARGTFHAQPGSWGIGDRSTLAS